MADVKNSIPQDARREAIRISSRTQLGWVSSSSKLRYVVLQDREPLGEKFPNIADLAGPSHVTRSTPAPNVGRGPTSRKTPQIPTSFHRIGFQIRVKYHHIYPYFKMPPKINPPRAITAASLALLAGYSIYRYRLSLNNSKDTPSSQSLACFSLYGWELISSK